MKTLALVIALVVALFAIPAYAATAYWTGQMRYVTTVTYQQAISCEYNVHGQTFWRTFKAYSCPSSVEVQ